MRKTLLTIREGVAVTALALSFLASVQGAEREVFTVEIDKTETKSQRRYVSVTIQLAETVVALTPKSFLTAFVLGNGKKQNLPPDAFGPPQSFALKGTSHELGPRRFRVVIALPLTKTKVELWLDHNGLVHKRTIEL